MSPELLQWKKKWWREVGRQLGETAASRWKSRRWKAYRVSVVAVADSGESGTWRQKAYAQLFEDYSDVANLDHH